MGKKEKGYLELPPGAERDYRLLMADKLLTALSPETRMDIFKTAFLEAAKDYNDEAAFSIICAIGKEYYFKEREVADKTDKHYGDADRRSDMDFGHYLRDIYWLLPDKEQVSTAWSESASRRIPVYGPALFKTKANILKVCVSQWAGYYNGRRCFEEIDDESRSIFSFLLNAYNGLKCQRYVSKEEKEEILKLFREKTDSSFTPEIAEKWLAWEEKWLAWEYSTIPEEIKKIFIVARARNGGMELLKREVKYAKILKPMDVKKRSEAALEFHKEFCVKLARVDEGIKKLIDELDNAEFFENAVIKTNFYSLENVELSIYYKKGELPWEVKNISGLGQSVKIVEDICAFLKNRNTKKTVRLAKISFVFYDGPERKGYYDNVAYLE